MTPELKQNLINEAKLALEKVFPKNSQYIYGAAVLTKNGNIYSAANYGSKTATLTAHSEQAAILHAAAHNETDIIAIATASNETLDPGTFTAPCHMCKQLLWESHLESGLEIEIIMTNEHKETQELKLTEIINYPWPEK